MSHLTALSYGVSASHQGGQKYFILLLSHFPCFIGMMCFSELQVWLFLSQGVCQLEYLGCAVKDYWYFLWQGSHCCELQVNVRYARARLLRYKLSITIQLKFTCSDFGWQDSKSVANQDGGPGERRIVWFFFLLFMNCPWSRVLLICSFYLHCI